MDLEMPEMDGYEVTHHIREDTMGVFDPHIPIVAMTAHSLPQYREKALKAMMNDFITKPVNLYKLAHLIGKIQSQKNGEPVPSNEPPPLIEMDEMDEMGGMETVERRSGQKESHQEEGELALLNQRIAIRRLGGDEQLYFQFCSMFLEELPEIHEKLQTTLDQKDMDALRKHAHYLKGSAAMIGAEQATLHASELEQSCKNEKDPLKASELLRLVLESLDILQSHLSRLPKPR